MGGFNLMYSKEVCLKIAHTCSSKSEFQYKNKSAYNSAWRNGWLEEMNWLPERKKYEDKIWTYEECYNEARKYKKLVDFINNSRVAYYKAKDNNWLKDYTWLEVRVVFKYEDVARISIKYSSYAIFREKEQSKCQIAKREHWLNDYYWFSRPTNWKKTNFTIEELYHESMKYASIDDFKKYCINGYNCSEQ